MRLKLTRPLVFFDLEATGTDTQTDRIVQMAFVKIYPNGDESRIETLVNPGMPIPKESTAIHGITDEMVAGEHPFAYYAQRQLGFLEGCDLAGFNVINYDIPLLYNEFQRAGKNWEHTRHQVIDVGTLYKIQEPRTLEAAVKFYTGDKHTEAHSAIGDTVATVDVLTCQLNRYPDLPQDVGALALVSNYGKKRADVTGKFTVNEAGAYVLNFGPHRGKVAGDHPDYLEWMLSRDFPSDAQAICEEILYPNGSGMFEGDAMEDFDPLFERRSCRRCGCTDDDCSQCIEAQGFPCHWVEPDLCSRCRAEMEAAPAL